jgi:glycerate dehydrogenase
MKKNTVFLNSEKLNFDNKLDFSPLTELTTFTQYAKSSNEEILERLSGQNIVITKEMPVGKDVISRFPDSVKLICEAGTGYNNIDIAMARDKGILVCNVPTYSTEAVAHLAITFILNLSSSLIQQQIMLQRKNFDNFTKYLQVPHFELQGKLLGVIGGGAIGCHVTKIALTLGMNVLIYNPSPKSYDDPRVKFVSLEDLLKQSDFITLHCPLNANTKHLINKDSLKLVKPSAFIINTSRGALIKETDLFEALQNKHIAGAALDVHDPEPPAADNPLFAMENVIMTPHIGWRRIESRQRLIELTADNIKAYLDGKAINVVN